MKLIFAVFFLLFSRFTFSANNSAIDLAESTIFSDHNKSYEILTSNSFDYDSYNIEDKFKYHVIIGLAYMSSEKMSEATDHLYKAEKIKNKNHRLIEKEVKYLAAYYYLKGGYSAITEKDDPLEFYKKASLLYESIDHTYGKLVLYSNIAYQLIDSSQYILALDYAEKSYNLSSKIKEQSLIAGANEVMGTIYTYLQEDEYALKYRKKAMEMYKEIGHHEYYLIAKSSVAGSMITLKRYHQAETLLMEVINDPDTSKVDLFYAYQILGESYYERGFYEGAIDAFKNALLYKEFIYTNSSILRTLIYKMGSLTRINDIKKAKEVKEILEKDQSLQSTSVNNRNKFKFEKELSYYYEKTNDYKKSLEHYKNYYKLWSEFKDKNSTNFIHELKIKFATNQAENENTVLSHQNELAKLKLEQSENNVSLYIILFSLSFIIIVIITIVLFYQMKFRVKLLNMIKLDSLTQIYNRSYIIRKAEALYSNDNRRRSLNSILLLDIDNFKNINDTLGHDIGDKVLIEIAKTGSSSVRENDIFARFGGEEFVALLPYTTEDQALKVAERIRQNIKSIDYKKYGLEKPITASIGLASTSNQEKDAFNRTLILADKAMYKAKKSGKDKVVSI